MNIPKEKSNLHLIPPKVDINLNNNAKWAVMTIGAVIILFSFFRMLRMLKSQR